MQHQQNTDGCLLHLSGSKKSNYTRQGSNLCHRKLREVDVRCSDMGQRGGNYIHIAVKDAQSKSSERWSEQKTRGIQTMQQ
eukprot:scaffold23824_cov78-Skeletonema_dohrnii-CCMP3373.AAC.3